MKELLAYFGQIYKDHRPEIFVALGILCIISPILSLFMTPLGWLAMAVVGVALIVLGYIFAHLA